MNSHDQNEEIIAKLNDLKRRVDRITTSYLDLGKTVGTEAIQILDAIEGRLPKDIEERVYASIRKIAEAAEKSLGEVKEAAHGER